MPYKVLIVEDDEDTAAIEAISLRQLAFQVEVVHDGSQAIPTMKNWKPDIVILDLELPGKNGAEILKEMFLDPVLKELIIVANTVHMDAKDDLGFSYYVKYVETKNDEPVMINKLAVDENKQFDLRRVIAQLIEKKFGAIPPELTQWLDKNKSKR